MLNTASVIREPEPEEDLETPEQRLHDHKRQILRQTGLLRFELLMTELRQPKKFRQKAGVQITESDFRLVGELERHGLISARERNQFYDLYNEEMERQRRLKEIEVEIKLSSQLEDLFPPPMNWKERSNRASNRDDHRDQDCHRFGPYIYRCLIRRKYRQGRSVKKWVREQKRRKYFRRY